jgi:N-methylhydantoinase A
MTKISIDTGGTFTDIILVDGTETHAFKTETTDDLISGIMRGLERALDETDTAPSEIGGFSHGSTVALNALIEKEGARTALLTTGGFRDVLEIGRGTRRSELLYSPCGDFARPLIPRKLRFEVEERADDDGEIVTPLDTDDLDRVIDELVDRDVECVGVCYLYSYLNADHEQSTADRIEERAPDVDVSLSSNVSPEVREYRRMATTVVDAYIKPKVTEYISALEREVTEHGVTTPIHIMKSDGGTARSELAKRRPITQVVAGPVAGAKTAEYIADKTDTENLISFDMGGTSCDTSIIDRGEPLEDPYREISGMPINGPFVKIDNVGAGGGSIASVNEVGALRVGPKSAGSNPGPVCYGHGGTEPTVTDADLVLGLLNPDNFAGGALELDVERARDAIERHVAEPLGMSIEEAAIGIRNVIDNKMAGSVRAVSTDEGYDLRDFALAAFGGAGPLHAANVARELGVSTIVVPNNPGVASALGCLLSNIKHEYVRSIVSSVDEMDIEETNEVIEALLDQGQSDLTQEDVTPEARSFEVSFDMRYLGQAHNLNVAQPTSGHTLTDESLEQLVDVFVRQHRNRYGFVDEVNPAEVVNVRVSATGTVESPDLRYTDTQESSVEKAKAGTRDVTVSTDETVTATYYDYSKIGPGHEFSGPAILESSNSTIWIPSGFEASVDEYRNVIATDMNAE